MSKTPAHSLGLGLCLVVLFQDPKPRQGSEGKERASGGKMNMQAIYLQYPIPHSRYLNWVLCRLQDMWSSFPGAFDEVNLKAPVGSESITPAFFLPFESQLPLFSGNVFLESHPHGQSAPTPYSPPPPPTFKSVSGDGRQVQPPEDLLYHRWERRWQRGCR